MINGTTNVSMTGKIYYWYYPPVDIYFWAYAPAQDTSIVVNNTYPTSLLTVTIPVNADLDFTIADQLIKSSGMVALQFKHSLSKISFTIELVQDLVAAGYTITSQPTTTFNVNKWIGSISPVSDTLSWTTIDSTSVT